MTKPTQGRPGAQPGRQDTEDGRLAIDRQIVKIKLDAKRRYGRSRAQWPAKIRIQLDQLSEEARQLRDVLGI